MRAVGEWMHDDGLIVAASRLHVGRRVRWDFSVRSHQVDPGTFRLPANRIMHFRLSLVLLLSQIEARPERFINLPHVLFNY